MIGASIWPRARVGRSSSSAVRPLLPSFAFSGGWMHVPVTIRMVRRLFLHYIVQVETCISIYPHMERHLASTFETILIDDPFIVACISWCVKQRFLV